MITSTILRHAPSPWIVILILCSITTNLLLTLIRIQFTCNHARVLSACTSSSWGSFYAVFIVLLLLLDPMQHAFLPVVSRKLVFVRHKLSLLRIWSVRHRRTVLRCQHHTLCMNCCCTVYFHSSSCLAVSLWIASFVGFSTFTTLFMKRPTESIFIIGPLLFD